MRTINYKEYTDYLMTMQKSIFKILPLYEENNVYLNEYVKDLYDEIDNVLETIESMPNGAWYFTSKSALKILINEVRLEDNHKSIKKKVLHICKLIRIQIEDIENERC